MAVIFSGAKWRADFGDFTGEVPTGGSLTFNPQTTYFPGTFSYSLNAVSDFINLRSVQITHTWTTVGGGETHTVFGTDLTTGADGSLTGGTANVLATIPSANPNASTLLIGVSIAVADLTDAAATLSRDDDAALLRAALSGNDLAGLSGKSDTFRAYGGIDLIFSNRGDDVVFLGDSLDCAVTGTGNDKAYGGDGDDLLVGNQGKDRLSGGADRDIIDGGKGNDTLTGDSGADTFVFLPGDGTDTITDFNPAEDLISFGVLPATLSEVAVTQDGDDTLITFRDISIRVLGRDVADFALDPFVFRLGVSESRLDTFVNFFDFRA